MTYKKIALIIGTPTIVIPSIVVPVVLAVPFGQDEKMEIKYKTFNKQKDDSFIVDIKVGHQYFLKTISKISSKLSKEKNNQIVKLEATNYILEEALKKIEIPKYVEESQKNLQDKKDLPKLKDKKWIFTVLPTDANGSMQLIFPVKTPSINSKDINFNYKKEIDKYIDSYDFKNSISKLIHNDKIIGQEIEKKFNNFLLKEKEKLFSEIKNKNTPLEKTDKINLDYTGYLLNKFYEEKIELNLEDNKSKIINRKITNKFKISKKSGSQFKFIDKNVGDIVTYEKEIIQSDEKTNKFINNVNKFLSGKKIKKGIKREKNKKIIIYAKIEKIKSQSGETRTKVKENDKLEIKLMIFGWNEEKFKGGEGKNQETTREKFIAGFVDQMIGMKIEEEKNIFPTFPQEYKEKTLQGKTVLFHVKLNNIYRKWSKKNDNNKFYKKIKKEDAEKIFNWKNPNKEEQKFLKNKKDFELIQKLIFYQKMYNDWHLNLITQIMKRNKDIFEKNSIPYWYFQRTFNAIKKMGTSLPKKLPQSARTQFFNQKTIYVINLERIHEIAFLEKNKNKKLKYNWNDDNIKNKKEARKIIIKEIIKKINEKIEEKNLKIKFL